MAKKINVIFIAFVLLGMVCITTQKKDRKQAKCNRLAKNFKKLSCEPETPGTFKNVLYWSRRGGGGGAGTFLMEHMSKSGWVNFVIFEEYPWYLFVTKMKEGVPQAIFEKYRGTFLDIIMLQFVSNIRNTVKNSTKQNK